jgi:hypothetical protein
VPYGVISEAEMYEHGSTIERDDDSLLGTDHGGEPGSVLDPDSRRNVRMLRSRADSLVAQAPSLGEPLATAYRRRARELQLQAFLLETRGAARAA